MSMKMASVSVRLDKTGIPLPATATVGSKNAYIFLYFVFTSVIFVKGLLLKLVPVETHAFVNIPTCC